jgi:hypothetical protein
LNREITLRQITFLYLFVSVSTILRQVPQNLAREAGRSGYLSPVWSLAATALLTGIILILIKYFPGLNIYEIMVQLVGTFLAKLLILAYLLWILLGAAAKVISYSLTLEYTLMPRTRSDFFMTVMMILIFYALLRGMKTIFRFSELSLGTILILFAILFVCAASRLRSDYLLPVSVVHLKSTIYAARHVISVGGNIVIVLFFADMFGIAVTKKQLHKLWFGVAVFTVLAFIITLFTFGISGTALTASLPFPFYITVKSISFFQIFERFEVLVTLICILSDFVAISIFVILLFRCLTWLFHLERGEALYIPLAVIIFYLTYYISSTQFEFDYFYRVLLVNINLIFEYAIPLVLALICLIRRKKFKQQY